MPTHWTEKLFIEDPDLFRASIEARFERTQDEINCLIDLFNQNNVPKYGNITLKRPSPVDGASYEDLLNSAVKRIPGARSDEWIDHNVHDPGITVLELLNHVTQDLGYRTSYLVKDLDFLNSYEFTGGHVRGLMGDSIADSVEKGETLNLEHIKAAFEKLKKK